MPADIKDIITNIKDVYMSDSNLETLLDYERVLDELDLYTFANWKEGELVEGPIYEKYFVTCKWLYEYRKMPDPAGAERLLGYGCEITYQEDTLEYPIDIKSPDDYKPGTRTNKIVGKPVWIVTITMPKSLMNDIQQGSVELESETLEAQDIEMSQEEGLDDLESSGEEDQETAGNA
jgi:hypothetical protein